MPEVYFVNEKTGRKFRVVSLDNKTKDIVLEGDLGSFTEKFDKDLFKELGYKLVKQEAKEDA